MPRPPETVRRKAEVHGAQAWLAGLPGLVADLADRWSLTVGRVFPDATEALVAEVVRQDGTPAVLKLMVPRSGGPDHAGHEITALRLAGGAGCVRLLASDAGAGALLLERLGRSMADLDLPVARRHELLAALAQRFWRPAAGCGLPTGADQARALAAYVTSTWEARGRPCSERAVAHAVACAERRERAHDDERARLVHGDVHRWNALECPREPGGFALVDPDGLLADPEYDLGIILREDPEELLTGDPRERAHRLASLTGLDPRAAWEWGVVERVSTGLVCTSVGLDQVGRAMLAAADRIADGFRDL